MTSESFVPVGAPLSGLGWQPFQSYGFARCELGTPISAFEVTLVASFAPVAFLRAGGEYTPYAVFSLSGQGNAFVSPDETWQGGYVPSRLRCYPFADFDHADAGSIHVRQGAITKVSTPGAVPFLRPDGSLSEPVEKSQKFLARCRSDAEKTSRLMRKAARLGLFRRFKSKDLARKDRNRLFVIDWRLLNANRAVTSELSRDLLLQRVLHAHAVSLGQMDRLRALEARRGLEATGVREKQDSFLDGFMDAVGSALDAERSETRG